MAYLGTKPQSGFISQEANQYFTGLTQNYIDLNQSISSLSSVIVLVNGVVQENSTLSLTSSTRITLGDTLVSADKVTCIYVAKISSTQAPGTGTVTNDMLAGSIANSKLANSSITLNGSAVSLGGSATVGGDNTPSFYSYIDSNLSVSHNTQTLIPFNQEVYDIGGCFNTSSSNATLNGLTCPPHGFCPNEAGYYYFNAQARWNDLTASQQAAGEQEVLQIYTWFSSVGTGEETAYKYHFLSQLNENSNHIFYFNGTGNCMQMRAYQANNSSSTKTVRGQDGNPMTNHYTTYLHGFKLIT
mgnify:CR=1 FL=1